jgi:hypothetical protein
MTFDSSLSSTPAAIDQTVLAEYKNYADAQKLVDSLSDAEFDVKNLRIVGTGIKSVEQVTGRLTVGKAALLGAASGAWFGLLVGIIFGLFAVGSAWFTVLIACVLLGAGWGMLFGAVSHWLSRGRRDFTSVKVLEADQYAVMVNSAVVAEARRLAKL